ncbi:MAG TPA: hypothetical protein VHF69_12620, partial [Candidatus Synoicihabitans sp.]|nr:hypothetical protein [Candidatus Synoicihabitans sp.]
MVGDGVGHVLRLSQRRVSAPAAGLLTGFDSFVPVIPSVSLLLALSLLQPQRWRIFAAWFALGAAWGGVAVALLLRVSGAPEAYAEWIAPAELSVFADWLREFGAIALFGLALLPFPMRSAVIVCALSEIPVLHIAVGLLSGRLIGYSAAAWLVTRVPQWIARRRGVARILTVLTETPPSPPPAAGADRQPVNNRPRPAGRR